MKKRIKAIKNWQEGGNPLSSSGEDSAAKSGGDGGDSDHSDVTKEDEPADDYALPKSIPVNKNSNTFAGPSKRGDDSEEDADAEEEAEEEMDDVESEGEVKRPPITWKSHGSVSQRCEFPYVYHVFFL